MLKVKILTIGKTKEKWLDEALQEYFTRLIAQMKIEFVIAKDDQQLLQYCEKEKGLILLDPFGQELDSIEFSKYLFEIFEKEGSRLTFVIGGAEGLPKGLKGDKISLSRLTFTHQIVRLVLVEQIYRACEIQKGTGYHK